MCDVFFNKMTVERQAGFKLTVVNHVIEEKNFFSLNCVCFNL
jgi:hypothetical protein